jgi:alpha-L-fucosidase 2
LPAVWGNGAVEGLCARGGFEVSWVWEKGVAKWAKIKSTLGMTCRIREERQSVLATPGKVSKNLYPKNGIIEFETNPGQTYTVSFGVGVLIVY